MKFIWYDDSKSKMSSSVRGVSRECEWKEWSGVWVQWMWGRVVGVGVVVNIFDCAICMYCMRERAQL